MNFSKLSSAKMILTLLCVVLIQSAHSQVSRFSVEKFSNEKGETLPYRLLYPDYNTVRKYPLVVFLHGSGERGTDNEAQLKWGVANFASDENMKLYPSFVLAPQCPLESDWSNFSDGKEGQTFLLQKTPSKPMELLMALIQETIKKYPIDTNRIYITGVSMGGFGTLMPLNGILICLQQPSRLWRWRYFLGKLDKAYSYLGISWGRRCSGRSCLFIIHDFCTH